MVMLPLGRDHRKWQAWCSALPVVLLAVSGACASARQSLPARLQYEVPFYTTYVPEAVAPSAIVAHLPVSPAVSQDVPLPSLRALVASMNAFLDSAGWSTPLSATPEWADEGPAVDVAVASREDVAASPAADARAGRHPPLAVSGNRPSARWRGSLAEIARHEGADYVLFVGLAASRHPLWERGGLSLRMELPLGTGYVVPVSWVHQVGTPVLVLQLRGALLGGEGRVLRAGAEGIMAREPRVMPSLRSVLPFFTEDEFRRVLTEHRREDLPGQPLAWRVAIQNLVAQLLQRGDLTIQ